MSTDIKNILFEDNPKEYTDKQNITNQNTDNKSTNEKKSPPKKITLKTYGKSEASIFEGRKPFKIVIDDLVKRESYILERISYPLNRTEKIIRITLGKKSLETRNNISIKKDKQLNIYTNEFDNLFDELDEDIFDGEDNFFMDIEEDENNRFTDLEEDDFEEDDYIDDNRIDDLNIWALDKQEVETTYNYDYVAEGYTILYDCIFRYTKDINPNELKIKSTSKVNLVKKSIGNPKLIEDITVMLNIITNFNTDDSINKVDNVEIDNEFYLLKEFINVDSASTLRQYFKSNGKLAKEVYSDMNKIISISRYTSAKSNPLMSSEKFVFKGIDFPLNYKVENLKSATKSELDIAEKVFNSRTIYLPNTKVYTEIYGLNLDYIKNSDYEIIDTEQKLRDAVELCKKEMGDTGVVCYDAETSGLKFRRFIPEKDRDFLCTHSLSWKDGQSIIVPVRMRYEKNIEPHIANEYLKTILEVNPILAHNGAADVRFLSYDDIDLNLKEDTMHLVKHVLPFITRYQDTGFARYLDDLVKKMFGYDMIDMNKYVFKPSNATFDFSVVNREYIKWYGCPDTDLCRRLWKVLRAKLHPNQLQAYLKTVEFSKALAISSSYSGMGINIDAIKEEKNRAIKLTEMLEEVIYKITGEDRYTLSLTSASQRTSYIFGKMGAPISYARKTNTGELSADKFVMNKLASIPSDSPTGIFKSDIMDVDGKTPLIKADELNMLKYPVTKLIREYGDLNSNIKAHYNRMERLSELNVYYPDFSPGKTDTWRTIDGVQTMKNSLKKEIGPVDNIVSKENNEVWYWSTTDYRTQEICLAANQSEDWDMIDSMIDVETDQHTLTASNLWIKPPYLVTKKERTAAKTANFGIIYGMKYYALGQRVNNKDKLTPEEEVAAKELYELYVYKKAEMLKPLQMAKVFVQNNGYLVNKLAYKMVYPQIIEKDKFIDDVFDPNTLNHNFKPEISYEKRAINLGRLLNASGNYPIQSWAAGILMDVYCKFLNKIKEDGYENDIFVPLTVHDEIGLCFNKYKVHPYYIIHAELETLVSKLEYLKKEKVAPLYIGIGFGPNWYKAKDDPAEIPIKLQYIMQKEYLEGTAPTLEEILEEGIYEHFRRRICDYIRQRCIDLFPEMYESKHWYRLPVQDTLNKYEMFVGKQMNENFKIYIGKSTDIDMDVILRAIYKRDKTDSLDDIIVEDGEPIEDEFETATKDESIEFFYIDGKIHDRVTVNEDTVRINLTNLNAVTINSIKEYINYIKADKYNIHNKKVNFVENGKLNMTNIEILGIPMNFTDVFNMLLEGQKINYRIPPSKFYLENSVYLKDNKLVLSKSFIDEVKEKDRLGRLNMILGSISSKAFVAKIPIVIYDEKNDIIKDTGIKMIKVSEEIIERIKGVLDVNG